MDEINISFEDSTDLFIKEAERKGLTKDALFSSTLSRYRQQLENLSELQKILKENGLCNKESSGNIKINPMLAAFNTTCAGANRTALLLHKILSRTIINYDIDEFENY